VFISATHIAAGLSLTAVGVWGTSDFLGGFGSRRANAFLFTSLAHFCAMVFAAALALAIRLPLAEGRSMGWALAAGAMGGCALAFFYRALASGKMGLIAPVAAVLSAAIPTIVTSFSEGFPGWRHVTGFVLAGVGVWLISRTEGGGRPEGLLTAVLAGCGFAGFYLCIHQAGNGSVLWIAVYSRFGSLLVTLALVIFGRLLAPLPGRIAIVAAFAGILDITGSALFIRAEQIGRLDTAVVLSSLYPAVTVLLARIFLHEHFSRARTVGMLAALAAVPMIAG
jgi:drug/metabolite transporter (DMT)-like permease